VSGLLSPSTVLLGALALYAMGGLVATFVVLERRGRRPVVLAVVVVALVAQVVFYEVDSKVPAGPFRPGPLRLPEVLVLAALAARAWTATPRRTFLHPTDIAWMSFFLVYASAAAAGVLYGNEVAQVLFHGKLVVYVGGMYLLVSGMPVRRVLSSRLTSRPPLWLALGGLVAVQDLTGIRGHTLVPGVAQVGPDSASLYFGVALTVLALEATRSRPRPATVVGLVPLVGAPFVTGQRATFLHGAIGLAAVAVVLSGRTWRRRASVRPTELVLLGLWLVTVGALALLPQIHDGHVVPPLVKKTVTDTFGGIGKAQSSQARVYRWDVAADLVTDRPVFGSGLGIEHEWFQPSVGKGIGQFERGTTFDNVAFDLAVRAGLVGLGLFAIAVAASLRDGWRVWTGHPDPEVAMVVLGATVFVAGLLAKGVVESVLEKVVLACALGIALGVIGSAAADLRSREQSTTATRSSRGRQLQWT
jgi:O-antigen ligase